MEYTFASLQNDALLQIENAKTLADLEEIELTFLGRKRGKIALLQREIKNIPAEKKGTFGKEGNIARAAVEKSVITARENLENAEDEAIFFDYSAPAPKVNRGHHHPLSRYMREVEDVFGRLGFEVAEGAEIDDEHHNFNALNMPPDHPAREMQDTFWVKNLEKYVLRTQTSNMQIHTMEKEKPPFRLIATGKVFRKDSDATHSPMFHQMEGLMIDRDISLENLKFVLLAALRELISPDMDLRFRLSYFPFTEPGLEVDALLKVGHQKKWLEIGGAGMTHPSVLRNVGLNPEEWNGFAFGFGIERQVMIRHNIGDLRQFFENDVRFLEQF